MRYARIALISVAISLLVLAVGGVAFAAHNPAILTYDESAACGETTFSATITDPDGTHKVDNMYLVVSVDGDTQYAIVPIDGSAASLTVGPFHTLPVETKTISYRVWGGDERDYDDPLWNHYGEQDFGTQIGDYAAMVGTYSWVIAGPEDPNPFTNWYTLNVDSCATTKDECKNGGWEGLGFRNQGQCIRWIETGQDSR